VRAGVVWTAGGEPRWRKIDRLLTPEQPLLEENYPFLRQKICLMALIESVFKRNSNDRTMSFQTIAEETRLPLDEVEHLVMKALRCVADWLLTEEHAADNQPCWQPQVDTGFAGPGRSESTHNMGAAACALTRTNWGAGESTWFVDGEAGQCGTADGACSVGVSLVLCSTVDCNLDAHDAWSARCGSGYV